MYEPELSFCSESLCDQENRRENDLRVVARQNHGISHRPLEKTQAQATNGQQQPEQCENLRV